MRSLDLLCKRKELGLTWERIAMRRHSLCPQCLSLCQHYKEPAMLCNKVITYEHEHDIAGLDRNRCPGDEWHLPHKQLLCNIDPTLFLFKQDAQSCNGSGNHTVQSIFFATILSQTIVKELPQKREWSKHGSKSQCIEAPERCIQDIRNWSSVGSDQQ